MSVLFFIMSWSHFIKNPSYGEANYVDGEKHVFSGVKKI